MLNQLTTLLGLNSKAEPPGITRTQNEGADFAAVFDESTEHSADSNPEADIGSANVDSDGQADAKDQAASKTLETRTGHQGESISTLMSGPQASVKKTEPVTLPYSEVATQDAAGDEASQTVGAVEQRDAAVLTISHDQRGSQKARESSDEGIARSGTASGAETDESKPSQAAFRGEFVKDLQQVDAQTRVENHAPASRAASEQAGVSLWNEDARLSADATKGAAEAVRTQQAVARIAESGDEVGRSTVSPAVSGEARSGLRLGSSEFAPMEAKGTDLATGAQARGGEPPAWQKDGQHLVAGQRAVASNSTSTTARSDERSVFGTASRTSGLGALSVPSPQMREDSARVPTAMEAKNSALPSTGDLEPQLVRAARDAEIGRLGESGSQRPDAQTVAQPKPHLNAVSSMTLPLGKAVEGGGVSSETSVRLSNADAGPLGGSQKETSGPQAPVTVSKGDTQLAAPAMRGSSAEPLRMMQDDARTGYRVATQGSEGFQSPINVPESRTSANQLFATPMFNEFQARATNRGAELRQARVAERDPRISGSTAETKAITTGSPVFPGTGSTLKPSIAGVTTSQPVLTGDAERLPMVEEADFVSTARSDDTRIAGPLGSNFATTAPLARPHAAPVMRQIAEQIPKLSEGKIEIRLNPEELGRVRMQMMSTEQGMIVQINADRPETLDLLRRNIDQLARELADAGYEASGFSFGDDSAENSQDRRNAAAHADGMAAAGQTENDTPTTPIAGLTASADGLDIRL